MNPLDDMRESLRRASLIMILAMPIQPGLTGKDLAKFNYDCMACSSVEHTIAYQDRFIKLHQN